MRALYTLGWRVVAPLAWLKLAWRARREPGYGEHVGERYGRYDGPPLPAGTAWIHAVSVGETRAAAPLVERIERELPGTRILLTTTTATGRETGRALFGDRVAQLWIPYDLPGAMRRFLAHARPRFGVLMETELWPNLVAEASRAGVPLVLANARMSERSARGYARAPALVRPMLAALAGIAAQTAADERRLEALGARDVAVTGNLKFDVAPPADAAARAAAMRALAGGGRPLVLAASTREGEEAMLLDAFARHPLPPDALLAIVPRHPQRFGDVGALLDARGLAWSRRSAGVPARAEDTVMLGDSMGELAAWYGAADLAFVGGSLAPLGGQNLIEALAMGAPVLVGPHTFNFADAAAGAIEAGAARRVADADDLARAVAALLDDAPARASMRDAAGRFLAAHRGATDRTWDYLAARAGLGPREALRNRADARRAGRG